MADPVLSEQLNHTLAETHLDSLGERYRGKVRDIYRQRDRLFLVATDRLSAFDHVLTTIPFKGEVLNRLAQFWFEKTQHVVPNHVLDTPDPNVTVARATKPFAVEVVVRGYLTGSLWRDFQKGAHTAYGLDLPPDMRKDAAFPEPILTPSTKAPVGEHDEPLSEAEVVRRGHRLARGTGLASGRRRWRCSRPDRPGARSRGSCWWTPSTSSARWATRSTSSTRCTPRTARGSGARAATRSGFASGDDQVMLDKENVRQWLIREKGFSGHGPLPVIPEDVRVKTAELYLARVRARSPARR